MTRIHNLFIFLLVSAFSFYVGASPQKNSSLVATHTNTSISNQELDKEEEPEPLVWDFSISPFEPYFWLASTDADAKLAGNELPIDLQFFEKAVDNMGDGLQLKLELHLFAKKNKWIVIVDPTRLKADSTQGLTDRFKTKSSFKMVDMKLGYEVFPLFDVFVGARYTSQDMRLSIKGTDQSVKGLHKWWDPLYGARYRYNFNEDWYLTSGVYWGGFKRGKHDEYTSSASALLTYKYVDWLDINLGYRILKVNLSTGEGATEFMYDATFSGFLVGANISFF